MKKTALKKVTLKKATASSSIKKQPKASKLPSRKKGTSSKFPIKV